MTSRNHKTVYPWYSGSVEMTNGGTGYGVNVSIPTGRKNKTIVAVLAQSSDAGTPTVKFGGSAGAAFTSRKNVTTTWSEAGSGRVTILTYESATMTTGTVQIYAIGATGTLFIFILRGSSYTNVTDSSGTNTSNSLTSTLAKGGIVIGAILIENTGGAVTELNSVIECSDVAVTFGRMFLYIKNGAQATSVNGGGSWSGSHKYLHARIGIDSKEAPDLLA